jgi:pilus assembly protein CpaF
VDTEELEDLARSLSGRASAAVAAVFPGRHLAGLGEPEKARAEAELLTFCDQADQRLRVSGRPGLGVGGQKQLAERLFDDIFGLGFLERYCDQREPDCEEASLNEARRLVIRRSGNRIEIVDPHFADDEELRIFVQRVIELGGGRIDDTCPYATVRLPSGARASGIVGAISSSPRLTIRIPRAPANSLEDRVNDATIDDALFRFLAAAVVGRLNVVVTGATYSGKTTFVQSMAGHIPAHERIITIEEDPELQLRRVVAECVDLMERTPNQEGVGAIDMRQLVRLALRHRPDRIIVGEVRGAEAIDMLAAMNSGHSGSFCTLHSDAGRRGLTKLEHYIRHGVEGHWTPQAAKEAIAENIDLVVHLHMDPVLGRRVVHEVIEVTGCEAGEVISTNTLFIQDCDRFRFTGIRPRKAEQLEAAGWRPR